MNKEQYKQGFTDAYLYRNPQLASLSYMSGWMDCNYILNQIEAKSNEIASLRDRLRLKLKEIEDASL